MDRRLFLCAVPALTLIPNLMLAAPPLDYTRGLVRRKLRAGETVFVDFYTDWCTTCRAQERIINTLKSENPAYEKSITFVRVDWDIHSRSKLAKSLKIPRRSTLVVLKGNDELGRIVAGTSVNSIKALFDTALSAATA
jgi:thioredoxin 1